MSYGIVDRHLYSARPLINRGTIRVYAERFKALIREGERDTVCTFFRNNPIHPDEPSYRRPPLRHQFLLTDFARDEVGDSVPDHTLYYESNTIVREQVKNLYAPWLNRPFNSFNGGLALSLPGGSTTVCRGRNKGSEDRNFLSRSSKSMAQSGSPREYRTSRRSSPGRNDRRPRGTSPEIRGEWARAVAGYRR
jgi:hypothetical protein